VKKNLTILFASTIIVSAFGQADTSKYALFSFQGYLQHSFADKALFFGSKSTDITQNDIIGIDILLKKCIDKCNIEQRNKNLSDTVDITPYIRQSVAVINKIMKRRFG